MSGAALVLGIDIGVSGAIARYRTRNISAAS
jgi:hypothetical protein